MACQLLLLDCKSLRRLDKRTQFILLATDMASAYKFCCFDLSRFFFIERSRGEGKIRCSQGVAEIARLCQTSKDQYELAVRTAQRMNV